MATDSKCQELSTLLQKWRGRPKEYHTIRELVRYRREAEQFLNQDDNLYSIEWVSAGIHLTVVVCSTANVLVMLGSGETPDADSSFGSIWF